MPITVPGKRSRTAAAITCAVEWRKVSRSSLMAVRAKWSADYTKGLGARLNGAESLETGRDVVPAQRSLVERRLDVRMDLEDDRELVRQGNDRRAPGLASKAFRSETGRDVVPAQRSLVERRLDVRMDLEDDRELVRQGNDRRAPGLASKALLADGVHRAAPDAAVLGRRLLHRGLTPWAGADLERSDLLETVSDHHCVLHTIAVPDETVLPWRVTE